MVSKVIGVFHWKLFTDAPFLSIAFVKLLLVPAINLNIPVIYGLLETNEKGKINLKNNNVTLPVNYWL